MKKKSIRFSRDPLPYVHENSNNSRAQNINNLQHKRIMKNYYVPMPILFIFTQEKIKQNTFFARFMQAHAHQKHF